MKENIVFLKRVITSLTMCALLTCALFPMYALPAEASLIAGINSMKIEIALSAEQKAGLLMENMTVEQKVGQMFFCAFRQNASGGNIVKIDNNIEKIIRDCGIGGVVLFSENIQTAKQVTDYIQSLQQASAIPLFISIDEEGGRVLRTRALDVPRIPAALSIGNTGNAQNAYNTAKTIAGYLTPMGFNVDFAPVADVFTNPSNKVIGDRAFSSDAAKAAEMVKGFVTGALDGCMLTAVKHFPGHGDTKEDTHFGMASTTKTLAELSKCEFIPFQAGIDAGTAFVMTGHITTPNIAKDKDTAGNPGIPATFSGYLLQDVLRDTLGFKGIIITDSLEMGAITKYYTSEETAVKSVLAGVDMLLMPNNFTEAYNGMVKAVKSGKISVKRIDESVKRILTEKYKAALIDTPDTQANLKHLNSYTINNNNYVKLRDIAYILNGTAKQFEVSFDGAKNSILLISGRPYTAVGGEALSGGMGNTTATPAALKIYLDGKEINLTAYTIGGNTYFKLRDIGKAFDFNVTWNSSKNTVAINPYEKYTDD